MAASWRDSYQMLGSPGERDVLLGDFNLDQRVDGLDLRFLQSRLGVTSGATAMTGDLTRDGAVGRGDVAKFIGNFSREVLLPSPAPDAVVVHSAVSRPPATRLTATRRTRPALEPNSAAIDAALADGDTLTVDSSTLPVSALRRQRAAR